MSGVIPPDSLLTCSGHTLAPPAIFTLLNQTIIAPLSTQISSINLTLALPIVYIVFDLLRRAKKNNNLRTRSLGLSRLFTLVSQLFDGVPIVLGVCVLGYIWFTVFLGIGAALC